MFRKISLFIPILIAFGIMSVSAGSSVETYYVGNTAECKHMVYICDSGYKQFLNSRGCGCDKIFKTPVVEEKNYFQTLDVSRSSQTYTNVYSQRLIQSQSRKVSDKQKAEDVVWNYINRLYNSGYSDNQIYISIQKIEKRLDSIRNASSKQQAMIRYLKAELQEYERDYRDSYDHIYDVFQYYY